MFKFTAFKTQKPRSFKYKPLYYDPDQEAREERRREVLAKRGRFTDDENGEKAKASGEYSPGQLIENKRQTRIANSMDRSRGGNRLKIFTLLVVVLLLGYWILTN